MLRYIVLASCVALTACATVKSPDHLQRINSEVAKSIGLPEIALPNMEYNVERLKGDKARYNCKSRTMFYGDRVGDHFLFHELVHHYQCHYGLKYPQYANCDRPKEVDAWRLQIQYCKTHDCPKDDPAKAYEVSGCK